MRKKNLLRLLALTLCVSLALPAALLPAAQAAEATQPYMTWLTNTYRKEYYRPLGGTLMLVNDWQGNYGVLDWQKNELAVPCAYTAVNWPDSRTAVLWGDSQVAVDRAKGALSAGAAAQAWKDGTDYFSDGGLIPITENGKQGYFSPAGSVLVPAIYDEVHAVGGGKYILAKTGGNWGAFDHSGKVVFPFLFPFAWYDEGTGNIFAVHGSYLGVALKDDYLSWSRYAGQTVQMGPAAGHETVPQVASPVLLDGKPVELNAYLFKVNGSSGNNYVKLRDVAALLSGTPAQFEVGWDQATSSISLTTGQAYTSVGGELSAPAAAGDRPFAYNSSTIYLNGHPITLDAYTIDQNNYFKLRDLGEALGFGVDWQNGTVVLTTGG